MIERLGTDPSRERTLYLARLRTVEEWPEALSEPGRHFVAFLAMDAREVSDAEIRRFAESLLEQGAAYVCSWGPDCERVHDLFDAALTDRFPGEEDALVMTTWHADDDLDQALWFAMFSACPDDPFVETCGALLAIVVDNDAWAAQVERRLRDPERLNADVLP